MKNIKTCLMIMAMLLVEGCASPASGPLYSNVPQVPNDKAIVYMYRQKDFFQGGTYPIVFVDGEEKFPLRNGGFNFVELSPSEHIIELKPGLSWILGESEVKLNVKAGKTYYLKMIIFDDDFRAASSGVGTFFTVSGKSKFEEVSSELARKEISTIRLSE